MSDSYDQPRERSREDALAEAREEIASLESEWKDRADAEISLGVGLDEHGWVFYFYDGYRPHGERDWILVADVEFDVVDQLRAYLLEAHPFIDPEGNY